MTAAAFDTRHRWGICLLAATALTALDQTLKGVVASELRLGEQGSTRFQCNK